MPRNVLTFLWRTVYLQSVRRHGIATLIEIAVVAFVFYVMTVTGEPGPPLGQDSDEVDVRSALVPPRVTHVVYTPKSEYYDELLRAVSMEIYMRRVNITPDDLPNNTSTEESTSGANGGAHIAPSPNGASDQVLPEGGDVFAYRPPEVAALEDEDEVTEECKKILNGSSKRFRANMPFPMCLVLSNVSSHSVSLSFRLYVLTERGGAADLFSGGGDRKMDFRLGSTDKAAPAFVEATSLQQIVQQEHLKLQSKASHGETDYRITVGNMPGWLFKDSNEGYAEELAALFYLGFLVPLIRRMNAIQYEYSSGTAEHQCVMGLSDVEFFCGHFITCLIIGLVESTVGMLVMFLAKVNGKTYAAGMDPSLVSVSFVIYQIGYSMFTLLITSVFPKGWLAFITGIILVQGMPNAFSQSAMPLSLSQYFLQSKLSKLRAGFMPHTGAFSVMRIIRIARDYEGGASWSIASKRALQKDTVTIVEIWMVMLISDIVMLFLAWYLSKILPWSTDNPQNPLFCFRASYWRLESEETAEEVVKAHRDASRFEALPPDSKVVIAISNLTKVYGYKPALNGVDLKVYDSKITVLLGHNGAGKTTLMSILTGVQAPTSGVAIVCGFNVTKQRYQVRQRVSFCQQTDIFFEDLTCSENLLYFGSLKGVHGRRLAESVRDTLKLVGLQDKSGSMPRQLSGGMKRRMSIAMTLVSEPELVILDEPTAGMDPETRRNVWDALQDVAKKRTLLLSSHDMEEADAIADQIVMMASGTVICSGSTAFLKKACGVGYKLTLTKVPHAFNLHGVMSIIHETTPEAAVDDDKLEEVSIALGTLEHHSFPKMFKALENSVEQFGIAGIGVTVASMKDVYLKINMDWAPGGKEREKPVEENDIVTICKPIRKQRGMARTFGALFTKRRLSLARSWDLYVMFCLVPLALLVYLTLSTSPVSVPRLTQGQTESFDVPVSLGDHFPNSVVVIGESRATNVSQQLRRLVESERCSVHSTEDVRKDLREMSEADFPSYIKTYPMTVSFESNDIRMMANPTSPISLPILVNLVATAWLRALTALPKARINVTVSVLEFRALSPVLLVLGSRLLNWLYWTLSLALTYSLGFAVYASFPAAERLSRARDVQLMTGVWGAEFVFANFVFDFIYHVLFSLVWCAVHYSLGHHSLSTAGLILLALVSFGLPATSFGYLMAERAQSSGSAVVQVFLLMYIGGAVTAMGSNLLWAWLESDVVTYASLIVHPFALLSMLVKIWNEDIKAVQCKLPEFTEFHALGVGADCSVGIFSFTPQGIGWELVALPAEGILYLAIMVFLTSGYARRGDHFVADESTSGDEDVEQERKKVAALRQEGDFSAHSLLVWNLHKQFGTLHAVRGIHLALRPSECFGLLGVNGAGKTTTFQMLAALIGASCGDARTAVATLSRNARRWQSQISYCFQLGGLLDRLNAFEYLCLVGRLRGIPEMELQPMVDGVLAVVDLTEHASKECGVYSGGNRRKLSIAAALLGLQPFVFLDEPYAGVDVVSRNKISRAIAGIKKRSRTTFVLTSHNMDECEFSCDRLTIMVGGRMMCLGTVQHLREKYGQGYRLELLLKHTAAADAHSLNQAVLTIFAGARLKEAHQNLLSYHLAQRIPWSKLFTKLEELRKNFELEHVLVGENTLDDIFLNFAKAQVNNSVLVAVNTTPTVTVPAAFASPSMATPQV